MRFNNIDKFDNTGFVKTLMIPKGQARWRIYSYNVKDNMEDLKYYKELGKIFNIYLDNMIRLPQRHTKNILVAKMSDGGLGVTRPELSYDCDGAITNEKGLMLLTIQSDCTPVYILDPINRAIGMVHSGWRGTVNRITEHALDLMKENYGTNIENVLIHFGAAICGNCYEVGIELIDEFKKILKCDEVHKVFTPIPEKPEKFFLDVTESIKMSLIKYGVKADNITRTNVCTYHDGIYDSWRLCGDRTKQMLTGIMLI